MNKGLSFQLEMDCNLRGIDVKYKHTFDFNLINTARDNMIYINNKCHRLSNFSIDKIFVIQNGFMINLELKLLNRI